MLSRHALLIGTGFNDPSSGSHGHLKAREKFRPIVAVLAGDDSPARVMRARCALGAVLFAVLATVRADPVSGSRCRVTGRSGAWTERPRPGR